jgi:hypothetical protein
MKRRMEWYVGIRKVHPFSGGVWVAVTTIAVYLGLFREDAGEYVFRTGVTPMIGVTAAVSSLLFILGFIFNKWVFLSWGLMLAAGVFMSRFVLYMLEVGVDSFPMWISLALTMTTIGAWALERERHG